MILISATAQNYLVVHKKALGSSTERIVSTNMEQQLSSQGIKRLWGLYNFKNVTRLVYILIVVIEPLLRGKVLKVTPKLLRPISFSKFCLCATRRDIVIHMSMPHEFSINK